MLEIYLLALVAFFVTIDPVGMVPIYLALTGGMERRARLQAALRGVLIGALILSVFALAGDRALTGLGISMPAFRIAGGLMLLAIGFEMVFERRAKRRNDRAETIKGERARDDSVDDDIGVFPLAVPMIAGPGAIAAVVLQTSQHAGDVTAQLVVGGALASVLAGLLLLLLIASRVAHLLGPTLVTVLSRLLGLLLAALAVQFVIDGVRQVLAGH